MNKVVNYDVGEFPTGLKILLVDDDRTCLFVLERMLRKLLYQVTKCQLAREALALLRQDKNRFDIVLCDLHMPDMDGFKLLQIIELEMDLPVVMMSADDGKGVVMKGIIYGACDYLLKPVRMETVRLIWQHVVRRKKRILGEFQRLAGNINVNDRILLLEQPKDVAVSNQLPSKDKRILQILQRTREDEDVDNNGDFDCELTIGKKTRIIWNPELHDMFVAAINQLGLDNAVPKKILERMRAMNVTGLTRANIASHLQKYRLHLQKKGSRSRTDDKDLNANFDQASSLDNHYLQLQPTASSSQLPPQNIISSQSWSFERVNENVLSTAPSRHDQRIDILDSNIVSESSRCLPTDFSFYDPLAISNGECSYRNLGNGTEISNPLPAFDGLIYEPFFSVEQYDQEDFFRGPFE